MKRKLLAALWGIKLAWKIDRKMFLLWLLLSSFLAILPFFSIIYYEKSLEVLFSYISGGSESFLTIAYPIFLMGLILTIYGLSSRLNDDFLYMVMFDSYYLGLEEILMDSAQKIKISELMKKGTRDEYFASISRIGSLTDLMSSGVVMVSKIITIVSLLIAVLAVSKVIFFILILYLAFVIIINAFLSGKAMIVWSELRDYLNHANYFETVPKTGDTAKEIRIFGSKDRIKENWKAVNGKIQNLYKNQYTINLKIHLLIDISFYVIMGVILMYGLHSVINVGTLGPSILIALLTLCVNISDAISGVNKSFKKLDYGLYGLNLQKTFFDKTPQINLDAEEKKYNTPLNENLVFKAENMSFSYESAGRTLKDLSFEIKKGETVALVGMNGSGKTTLLKIMLGLLEPDSGEISFMGREYNQYQIGFISSKVGAFFQEYYLFHFTIQENVGIGSVDNIENEGMVLEAMEKGGALSLLEHMPKKLDTMVGKAVDKSGAMFSGGEGQRLAVSRAHMSDKEVLVFDEPASMLDPIAEMEQFENIRNKIGEKTAILVSHRVGFARMADRIIVLSNGSIVEDGTHEDLLMKDGVYASLYNEQAQWYDLGEGGDING